MRKNRLHFLSMNGDLMFAEEPSTEPAGAVESHDEAHDEADRAERDEQLGEGGKKPLRAERRRASDAEKRARDAEARLRAIEDAEKTDLQRATERVSELEAQLNKYQADAARRDIRERVIADKNVPSEWADFVTGDTEDEMNTAADRIVKNLTSSGEGPAFHATRGKPGGSLEAGREAAKSFRP